MKEIYKAARNWLCPHAAAHQTNKHIFLKDYPLDFRYALEAFEYRNRGHQHVLNDMSMHVSTRAVSGTEEYTRRNTIQDSASRLLQFFIDTPADVLPESAELTALLDAPDKLARLESYTLCLLQQSIYGLQKELGLTEFEIKFVSITSAEPHNILYLKIAMPRTGLDAKREINLPKGDCRTLRGAAEYYQKVMKFLRANLKLKDVKAWPEFSEQQQELHRLVLLRKELAKMVERYSPELRETLANHWGSLCPVPGVKKK